MSSLTQDFRWRYAAGFIAACSLLAVLYACKEPLKQLWLRGENAAEVNGLPVTRQELEYGMRERLWKRHESWASLGPEERKQTRWQVLENLVNDRLVRTSRSNGGSVATQAVAKRESEWMQRQFADTAEYPRRLTAQKLTPKSLAAQIHEAQLDEAWLQEQMPHHLQEVTQQEVRDWYEKFKDTLRIPQAHHAAHIFLTRHDKSKPDRTAEMREIQRQLVNKEKTFAQLAKEHSDDDRTRAWGGDLGWFTQERMPADFIAAVEKLKIGQFSEPVQTQLGWHLIIVYERRASRVPALAEVKEEIAALLSSKRREEAVQGLLAELRERWKPSVFYHAEVIERAEPAP
jgi:peptidyl-prolyl cis-trans isomerase C